MSFRISVVTPTLDRPDEIAGLAESLAGQVRPPSEWIVVDASDSTETLDLLRDLGSSLPFECVHVAGSGGTAPQRNLGIDRASLTG